MRRQFLGLSPRLKLHTIELGVGIVRVIQPLLIHRDQFSVAAQRLQSGLTNRLPFVRHHFLGEHDRALVRCVTLHQIDEIQQILPPFGSDQPRRVRVGKRLGRMVVAQETIGLLGIATDPHQIVPQELHGMVELVLRGLRKLLFGQE